MTMFMVPYPAQLVHKNDARRYAMRVKMLVMAISSMLLVAMLASGQERSLAKGNIPFAFSVENKVFPAGNYQFAESSDAQVIDVRSPDKKVSAVVPILTRLAGGMHTTPEDCHIVFDKVGETYTLSEIWVPGEDGFMLHMTKGKHEHRITNIPK
jgi:hypothetical protein